jgi:hypothetical protein
MPGQHRHHLLLAGEDAGEAPDAAVRQRLPKSLGQALLLAHYQDLRLLVGDVQDHE